jgi:hypothetical protein
MIWIMTFLCHKTLLILIIKEEDLEAEVDLVAEVDWEAEEDLVDLEIMTLCDNLF